MADVIRSFAELTAKQQTIAGGKGGTLARLYQMGYPVPDGFVILPTAFVRDNLTAEAFDQMEVHLERVRQGDRGTAFAIRSSALSEDSAFASFAGEFETVLDVATDQEVRSAVHTVRRSRQSERVKTYSQDKSIGGLHEMAVVVQRLVRADISGVLFTADPITGRRMRMTGNFVHGMGEKLVSGEANPKSFTLDRPQGIWPKVKYDGPSEMESFAGKLYRLGSRLEKELGCPQDIEWAIADDKLFLLQSRPITTLIGHNLATGEWNDSLIGDFLWSNVNFGEAIAEVMTPFTWAAVQRSALGERITFEGYRPFGNIGGRLYLNLSVFASAFHVLGKNTRQSLELIEGTLHLNLPEGMEIPLISSEKRSWVSTLFKVLAGEWRQKQDVWRLSTLLASNPVWCEEIQGEIREVRTGADLVSLWRKAIEPRISRIWSGVLSSATYHDSFTTPLHRELLELVGPDDADALISGMSSESELLASLGPVVGLSKLLRGEMTREAYLEEYGHRGSNELELSSPRPAENPDWFDRQLVEFERSPVDVEALLAKRRTEFEAAWQRLSQRYPRKIKSLRRRIDQVSPRARLRERARSEFARIFWVWRAWALRAGEMTGLGEDIFFLDINEVLEALFGNREAMRYIPMRRDTYERYKTLPPYPPVIRGRFDPFGGWSIPTGATTSSILTPLSLPRVRGT